MNGKYFTDPAGKQWQVAADGYGAPLCGYQQSDAAAHDVPGPSSAKTLMYDSRIIAELSRWANGQIHHTHGMGSSSAVSEPLFPIKMTIE